VRCADRRALHLADLYNWADAAPAFTEAEKLFAAAGDQQRGPAKEARLHRIPQAAHEFSPKRFRFCGPSTGQNITLIRQQQEISASLDRVAESAE
jgi:hypothetical protein